VAGPTWDEAPESVWALLRQVHLHPVLLVRSGGVDAGAAGWPAFDGLAARLTSLPGWRRHRILTGQVVDARLGAIRRAASDAVRLLGHREHTKAALLALGGELRRVHLELGRRLRDAGRLVEPGDIDLLRDHELEPTVDGAGPVTATLTRRRHRLHSARLQPDLPTVFQGRPPDDRPPLPVGSVLQGWGAGTGRHEGTARVVHDPLHGGLEPGEVLVARSTDASWSPLFTVAGAIVVEEGGPLSHAAIVARELGIPAVLNVPGAVERLDRTGLRVTVDGDVGVVVIDDGEGSSDG
jgi:rifampicin phosphotransferase